MNITFFIGGLINGGAERVVCNLSNYLSAKHTISIVTMSCTPSTYRLQENVLHCPLEKSMYFNNKIIKNVKRIIALKKIIKTNHTDVYIVFLPITNFILLTLRKFVKVPIIVSVRNDPRVEYHSILYQYLMKKLYPRADGFVFQTEEARNYFDAKIQERSVIIQNPLRESFMECEPVKIRKKNIVSVGRLAAQKNFALLIAAFKNLKIASKEYRLVIYGEGELRNKLEKKIHHLQLQDSVFLPGQIADLKACIYDASLFVLSSDYEGVPNALIEAMALGLPCIATECPGTASLIENRKNGLLVPIKNEKLLTEAMRALLADKEYANQLGKEAQKIREKLDVKKIGKQWEEYIKTIKTLYQNDSVK